MDRKTYLHLCRTNFGFFNRVAFGELNKGHVYQHGFHCDAIVHVLNETAAGRRKRQLISAPPRSLKSQTVSMSWPAFLLGQDPATKIVGVSYGETLAQDLSDGTRRLMNTAFYKEVFPHTTLDRQTKDELTTTEGGMRLATTIGSAITGLGGSVIIVDDPLNSLDALSDVSRERVHTYFKRSLLSRLTPPADGAIVVVAQRLHEDDLTGHLLEGGGWEHLKIPAIATETVQIPIGEGRYHTFREGELMLPSYLPRTFLDQQKQQMGSSDFAAQFLQAPTSAAGALVKRKWLKYGAHPPLSSGTVYLSVDAAAKAGQHNDYSVCTVWLNEGGYHYLVDLWRDKVDITKLLPRIVSMYGQYNPSRVLIEDASAGIQLIQLLQQQGVPAIPCKPIKSKKDRLYGVLPHIETGMVIFPKAAPWLDDLVHELLTFPRGRTDDQVDSLSQYLAYAIANPPEEFSYDMMRDDPLDHGLIGERYAASRYW